MFRERFREKSGIELKYEEMLRETNGRVFHDESHYSLRKEGIEVEIFNDGYEGTFIGMIDNGRLCGISTHLNRNELEKLHETLSLMLGKEVKDERD